MELTERYGSTVWHNATVEDVLKSKLDEAGGGQVERLNAQVQMLAEMMARLLEKESADTALRVIGVDWEWEVTHG